MGSKTLRQGKRTGLTRNQQRKADYARLAAASQRKGGGGPVVVTHASPAKGKLRRTNHKRGHAKAARDKRRAEGEARATAWAKLNATEQIAALDKRLGAGVGAVKQRARILNPPKFTPFGREHNAALTALTKDDEALLRDGLLKAALKHARKAKQHRKETHDKASKK